jgi:hypothetical protein
VAFKNSGSKRVRVLQAIGLNDDPAGTVHVVIQSIEELECRRAVKIPGQVQVETPAVATNRDSEVGCHAKSSLLVSLDMWKVDIQKKAWTWSLRAIRNSSVKDFVHFASFS